VISVHPAWPTGWLFCGSVEQGWGDGAVWRRAARLRCGPADRGPGLRCDRLDSRMRS